MELMLWKTKNVKLARIYVFVGWGRSEGIATRYGLDGPGIESRWGTRFSAHLLDRAWDSPSFLYIGYRISFLSVKRPECGVNHPPPSSVEVKGRVELYLYSPSGPSRPFLVRTLTFYVFVKQNLSFWYNNGNCVQKMQAESVSYWSTRRFKIRFALARKVLLLMAPRVLSDCII